MQDFPVRDGNNAVILHTAPRLVWAIVAVANSDPMPWGGGVGTFAVFGTFGGTTAKLQCSFDDGTTWIDVDRVGDTYVTFTANGAGNFELGPCILRVVTTGGAGITLAAQVRGVDA